MTKSYYSPLSLEDFAEHGLYCEVREVLTRTIPDHNFGYSIKDMIIDYGIDDEPLEGACSMMQDWYENQTTGCEGADRICKYYHDKMMKILEGNNDE